MIKRILSLFLTALLLMTMLPATAGAEEAQSHSDAVVASGTCGENLTWVLDDEGTLTISGTGAMDNYVSDAYDEGEVEEPWSVYRWQILHVVAEEGVTTIGDFAFDGYNSIISVTIPSTLESFGIYAFRDNRALEAVFLSDLAAWCEISFFISSGDYRTNNPLSSAEKLYLNGELVTDLVIPEGVTYINDGAFYNCPSFSTVTLPDSVTGIGSYAFAYCSLESMRFSENLTTIEPYAFWCADLPAAELPEGLTTIESHVFDHCAVERITIPSTLTCIEEDAFYGLEDADCIKEVHLRDLGAWCNLAFEQATSNPASFDSADLYLNGELLTEAVIPEGTTLLKDCVFLNCDSLVSVTLPESLNQTHWDVFKDCDNLKSVTFLNADTEIFSGAFMNCVSLTEIVLPENLDDVSADVFNGCTKLKRLALPGNVTEISYDAFNGCSALRELSIPAGVTHIRSNAFAGCTALAHVYFGGTEEQWNTIALSSGNEALTNATIHYLSELCEHDFVDNVCSLCGADYVDDSIVAGGDCGENLTWKLDEEGTLTISGSGEMTAYEYNTTPWCGLLEDVRRIVVEDGVESICAYAFFECKNVTEIILPNSVTSIGMAAFRRCSSLTSVTLPSGLTSIESNLFSACSALESIVLPAGITSIGESAFNGCAKLRSIVIPESVTSIAKWGLSGCVALDEIEFKGSAPAITEDAFTWVTATALYPENDPSWTETVMENYGGTITWVPACCREGHSWSEWTVKTEPTESKEGEKTRTCSACGKTETKVMPAGTSGENPFTDIQKSDYYYEPVLWAVEEGITNGYGSDSTFCPDIECSRAQVVTFLWRAKGSPAPASSVNPFRDVPNGEWYSNAVLWAVEQGITQGYGSSDTFNPNGICTRAQVVTFLQRCLGGQASSDSNPFDDVPDGDWYTSAVLWAVEEGITNGYGGNDTFAPDLDCTRGQIVTFLYRAVNE